MTDMLTRLRELRAEGVVKATFHPDGSVASVEFGPEEPEGAQNEVPKPSPRVLSTTGRLVPRVVADR